MLAWHSGLARLESADVLDVALLGAVAHMVLAQALEMICLSAALSGQELLSEIPIFISMGILEILEVAMQRMVVDKQADRMNLIHQTNDLCSQCIPIVLLSLPDSIQTRVFTFLCICSIYSVRFMCCIVCIVFRCMGSYSTHLNHIGEQRRCESHRQSHVVQVIVRA